MISGLSWTNSSAALGSRSSELQANKELRAMLNLGAKSEAPGVTKLSDAELIQQLADQAKELGIEIDLNYGLHRSLTNEPFRSTRNP
jgi:hypothetical protein